ncbi:MAG: hypothetical protein LH465_08950 [Sphingomonas bacterium]|nr:hypothetical protein [Sphingomonas bacterium]
MKAFVLLFSDRDEAAAQGQALSLNDWNVVVTGPNNGTEILQEGKFVAQLASSWAVFASKEKLRAPSEK